jgi:outer membrane protein W
MHRPRPDPLRLASAALLAAVVLSAPSLARGDPAPDARWSMRTRAFVSGESFDSEPVNYKAYSGIALEAALRRALGPRWAAELSLHTESREVDHLNPGAESDRLGSLELLPATLTVLYRPTHGGSLHPYGGAGVNLTVAWEKSGVLDSLDVSPGIGPAVQVGADLDLAKNVLFNVDLRWNRLRTELKNHGVRYVKLDIDPVTLGAGIGFRF